MKPIHLIGAAPRALCGLVRAEGDDTRALFAQLNAAVTEMRSKHEQALASKVDDSVLNEQVDRINAEISKIEEAITKANTELAAARLGDSLPGDMEPTDPEYRAAFNAHFRKGDVSAALSVGTDAEGGYLAPVEWDRTITGALKEISPIRQHAQVITTSTAGFKRLYSDRTIGSGWVGETAARPETATPGVSELTFGHGEIYANPAATQAFIDDAAVNVERWLADEVNTEFAYQEGIAFLSGNGTNKPFGILTYVTGEANAAKHPFGAITAKAATSATDIAADELVDLVYSLPSSRRAGARFFMNNGTMSSVRKLKDGEGNYLWQPGYQDGEPGRILGYATTEIEGMPDAATGAIPMLFGDMRMTYLVIDRVGTRILRDPYTNKPFVHFYTTKRVGGGVQNPEFMKALKMA
ncbi:phage major capsid protein [Novosphingobium sp. BW1]|nr:phage major capsid protein [Novosphingobium sp. BW1]